jgi:O-antigen ligase
MLELGILLAVLWGYASWKYPERALAAIPVALPLYVFRFNLGPLPTTALELIIIATIVVWLVKNKTPGIRRAWTALGAWQWPCVAWLAVGLLSVIISPVHLAALGLYRAYFIEPIILFAIARDLIRTSEHAQLLARSLGLITILLGVWAFFQFVTGHGIPHPWDVAIAAGRRSVGPFPFPNALSLFVAPIAAFLITDLLKSTTEHLLSRPLAWATLVASITAILCARSIGGMIALLVAAAVALLFDRRTRVATIAAIAVATVVILTIPAARLKVTNILTFKEWSGSVRVVMWKEAVNMLRDRPFTGAGLSAYPTAIKPYHKATWMEVFQYPHNILLNLWSEVGPVGVILFAWIILTWIFQFRNSTLPIILAILIQGLVDVPYFKNDLAVLFWLLVLVTTSTENSASRDPAPSR